MIPLIYRFYYYIPLDFFFNDQISNSYCLSVVVVVVSFRFWFYLFCVLFDELTPHFGLVFYTHSAFSSWSRCSVSVRFWSHLSCVLFVESTSHSVLTQGFRIMFIIVNFPVVDISRLCLNYRLFFHSLSFVLCPLSFVLCLSFFVFCSSSFILRFSASFVLPSSSESFVAYKLHR